MKESSICDLESQKEYETMFNIKYDENSEYKHGYIDLDDYDSTKPTNETEYE